MSIYSDDMRELRARQDGQIKEHNQFSAVVHVALGGLAVGYMTLGNRWMLVLILMLILGTILRAIELSDMRQMHRSEADYQRRLEGQP